MKTLLLILSFACILFAQPIRTVLDSVVVIYPVYHVPVSVDTSYKNYFIYDTAISKIIYR